MIDIELQFGALRVVIAWPSRSQPAGEHLPAQPVPAGEQADTGEGMSAEDAAIIRRIRTQSPDKRFDGGTDAELLDLFRRNKRVLSRSDDDVIATMTRPR